MSEKIYDIIRRQWVAKTPEEVVRQKVLSLLINHLGYPKGLISVEKKITDISLDDKAPNRRMDILCYYRCGEELLPLLLIECKSGTLHSDAFHQVVGYNDYVKSRYISIVNDTEIKFGWYNIKDKKYSFIDGFPYYKDLLES